ncbi:MAG: 4Fe-4S binding protein [Candidatus Omnitrophica bacterium]|nr:4Fe-4S binding protein [Candidatus Omnitrophota bacterium]
MRYPKLRELKEAVKALIKGPYTIKYPYQPAKTYERFRGRPYFHEEECIGCTACAQVCPSKAIEVKDTVAGAKGKRKLTVHWDICIFCGQCQANCPTGKGIVLSREFEFATTEKREALKQEIEKEFVLCECCQEPVAPYDQYVWTAKRLGPLCFSNSSLVLFYLRLLNFASKAKSPPKKEEEISRAERIRVLCPRCRRQAVIKS